MVEIYNSFGRQYNEKNVFEISMNVHWNIFNKYKNTYIYILNKYKYINIEKIISVGG